MDAQRIADTAALVAQFHGRPVTDEGLRAAEQQAEALTDVRPLIQVALDAAPRLSGIAAALRPAGGDLHAISAVISLATVALARVIHPPDSPG